MGDEKKFKIGDKVIVIGPYESDNYWVGVISSMKETEVYIEVGNQRLLVNIDDLEHYDDTDRKKNWVEFYRNKHPNPYHWEGD